MAVSAMNETPLQPTLRRLRVFAVRPDRDLGQNFLIDSNILGVIGRAAELREDDVVLEIGGGLGVLSEYLAERVRRVHVVEVDTRLRGALEDAVAAIGAISGTIGEISAIAAAMAAAIRQQESARQEIAANVQRTSAGTSEVLATIGGVAHAVAETGRVANGVLDYSTDLGKQATTLESEVAAFLAAINRSA